MIYKNSVKIILALTLLSFTIHSASAYVAGSSSYRIETDTISIGGTRATSAGYVEQSSLSSSGVSGPTTGTSYAGSLGYLQASDAYISLTTSSGVTLSPDMKFNGGGQSTGSGSATVTTNSTSGYSLYISASTNPALQSSEDSFLDYVTVVTGTPDFSWSVGSGTTGFGFSPEGTDIVSLFKDNGTACGVGGSDATSRCWYPLSTTIKKISQSAAANNPGGTVTTLKFTAEAGSSVNKKVGNYSAVVTLTALAL